MDELLFRVFAEHVGRYLDGVDRLAAREAVARGPLAAEARRLVAAWRAVLELHEPGVRRRLGRPGCPGCARRGMCGVWRVACAYFTISSRRRAG